MFLKYLSAFFLLVVVAATSTAADEYDNNVNYYVYQPGSDYATEWVFGTSLTSQGCNGNISFVLHGWNNAESIWSKPLIDRLLEHRGGCAVYVNWGRYSDDSNYPNIVVTHVPNVSKAFLRRLQALEAEGVDPSFLFVYGHSLGARIGADAGIEFGGRIPNMDFTDPAGPGFYHYDKTHDTKLAAGNVQVIHTSTNFGTVLAIGHQDWYMGFCGAFQPGADPLKWVSCKFGFCEVTDNHTLSHMMANVFYIAAFDNAFLADDCLPCPGVTKSADLPQGFRMGFLETRRNRNIIAKISSPTSFDYPYNSYGPVLEAVCKKPTDAGGFNLINVVLAIFKVLLTVLFGLFD